eukprot:457560-Rhodomonas_salina.1
MEVREGCRMQREGKGASNGPAHVRHEIDAGVQRAACSAMSSLPPLLLLLAPHQHPTSSRRERGAKGSGAGAERRGAERLGVERGERAGSREQGAGVKTADMGERRR